MFHRLRQLLLVLIALALVSSTSSRLARSAEYVAPMMMAGMPCDMMMSQAGMQQQENPMPPCKGTTSDCFKHMCCVGDAALPARTPSPRIADDLGDVDYWSVWSKLTDFVHEPDPLPPRTI